MNEKCRHLRNAEATAQAAEARAWGGEALAQAAKAGDWNTVENLVKQIADQTVLSGVVLKCNSVASLVIPRITDQTLLAQIALHMEPGTKDSFCGSAEREYFTGSAYDKVPDYGWHLLAVSKMTDKALLRKVADGGSLDVAAAAREKLTDIADMEALGLTGDIVSAPSHMRYEYFLRKVADKQLETDFVYGIDASGRSNRFGDGKQLWTPFWSSYKHAVLWGKDQCRNPILISVDAFMTRWLPHLHERPPLEKECLVNVFPVPGNPGHIIRGIDLLRMLKVRRQRR